MNYKKGIAAIAVLGIIILVGFIGFLIYIENNPSQEITNNSNVLTEEMEVTDTGSGSSSSSSNQQNQSGSTSTNTSSATTNSNISNTNITTNVETNTGANPTTLSGDVYVCPFDDTPFFFITSPNGGEQYEAGQNITLTWESCNIPPTAIFSRLNFVNVNDATKNETIWVAGGEAGWEGMPSPLNDESEMIPLSNNQTGIIVEPGTYEVCMTGVWVGNTPPGQGISVSDCSDETFVIN